MNIKPHLALDSYKLDHRSQYPEGTELVYSNMTARSSQHFSGSPFFDNKIVLFGIQGMILDYLVSSWEDKFFTEPKSEVVSEYKRRVDAFLGAGAIDTKHIEDLHDLGYLPIEIKALPEGSRVDIKVPFITVRNTLPQFYWITNYIETALSAMLWKPITIATIAYEYRRILDHYVDLTGSSKEFADWQLHDFSARGLSGLEDVAMTGAAHLASAGYGSDNLLAVDYLEDHYLADCDTELIAGSVPATEHSVMCMGGKDTELDTFRRLITEVYPTGIVSIVSDTWNFFDVLTKHAVELKEDILARKTNALGQAKVVFRPDSGDPVKIITGYVKPLPEIDFESAVCADADSWYSLTDAEVVKIKGKWYPCGWSSEDDWEVDLTKPLSEAEVKGAVECLWEVFGGTVTEKGYKTLHERVGLIYGDSITLQRCKEILGRLEQKGFSAGNIVFGIGSYTYQYITRDTFGMAMKATYGVVNGEARELEKDPATGDGVKKSAKGLLRVEKEDGKYVLYDQQTLEQEGQGALTTVFCNGDCYSVTSLEEIRKRIKGEIV